MSSDFESIDEKISVLKLEFNFLSSTFTVENPVAQNIYDNGYFGRWISEKSLILEPEEILLLLDRGKIEIMDLNTGSKITSPEIVAHFTEINKDFWSRYLVYKDLRNRGYVVQIGTQVTAPFRIYSRGGKPGQSVSKTIVFPLPEGEELDLDFLDQIVNQSKIDRKKLLLSVVDRLGDVTYYQASQLQLEKNELEYEYRDEGTQTNEN
jgi:tRNA-intron endonuclease